MLDFDKFTNYSQEILASSSNLMAEHKNPQIEPEHIMLALFMDENDLPTFILEKIGLNNPIFLVHLSNYFNSKLIGQWSDHKMFV
jgi:ATP-dependent Clp protease ATP-binding subunit ClpB